MSKNTNIIWIDLNLDNEENSEYSKELKQIDSLNHKLCKNVDDAVDYMKKIKFKETKVIVSGSFYPELVERIKENLIDMCITPKIIVFTNDKNIFMKYNKDYESEDNKFYSFGGIATSFDEVKAFLNIDTKSKKKSDSLLITQTNDKQQNKENSFSVIEKIREQLFQKSDDIQLTFEYIDKKEKLILPLFFKTLIDNASNKNMKEYNNSLYNTYSENNIQIKELLGSMKSMSNIPLEILSKYYARLYTANSNFHKDLNTDLRLNKIDKFLFFIKTLYEGVKVKSLPLATDNVLYRGSVITYSEINKIKDYIKNKKEGLPSSIVFSKSFLSFSKDEKQAEIFLEKAEKDNNLSKVLFKLEKDNNIGYSLSTHGDIENISFYPKEREVLFFPFSSFEIKEIKEINIGKEKAYEIKLLYLGKYLKEIENDKQIIISENKIPDSEFKNQLIEFGLIEKEKIENINCKILYKKYKKYEKETTNVILGEIEIGPNDINKDIQIINSFENYKAIKRYKEEEDDYKYENEKEIKENIEININGKKIDFSYTYKFEKEGKYKIEYVFKNNLTKSNHMFYYCSNLITLDLSKFNAQNITDMNRMFESCNALINLNLSNFNTFNSNNMSGMFDGCESLKNIKLSSFNTQNVTDMSYMFSNCKSLTEIDLSNFITQNVKDMSGMFEYCSSLKKLNLSNFTTENIIDMSGMFLGSESLRKQKVITKDNRILQKINK